jgi:aldose 1-epimerase
MPAERARAQGLPEDNAHAPMAPGPLLTIGGTALSVDVAPLAGGRIAQIRHRGVPQLIGPADGDPRTIGWGCFPMAPWAGRIRAGCFTLAGREIRLRRNLEPHAIHGVAFAMAWTVAAHGADSIDLSLVLPVDDRWPFGGTVVQRIAVVGERLRMEMTLTAGDEPMPAVIGWHPWFRKPDRIEFEPDAMFPRDAEGIATLPPVPPGPPPWDDCFVNTRPVVVHRGNSRITLISDCKRWVVFDEMPHATCVEPQTGTPDAFNADPMVLSPGAALRAWFDWEWRCATPDAAGTRHD